MKRTIYYVYCWDKDAYGVFDKDGTLLGYVFTDLGIGFDGEGTHNIFAKLGFNLQDVTMSRNDLIEALRDAIDKGA